MPPSRFLNDTATRLSNVEIAAELVGHALYGEMLIHSGEPSFHAHFRSTGVDVFVQRGDNHETYPRFEEGSYRLENERLCVTAAFDLEDACFALQRDGDGYAMVRDDGRVIWTDVLDDDL